MSKKRFKVVLDKKVIIWHRTSADIEADSLEEAKQKLLEYNDGTANFMPEHITTGYLYDTMEELTQRENCLMAESHELDLDHELLKNIDDYPVEEFPDQLNYQITKNKPDEEV